MATASANSQSKAVASAASGAQRTEVQVSAPSRREFLYYIWGASIALLLGEATAGLLWFAFPRFKEGEFGGVFPFDPVEIPTIDTAPTSVPSGRFHVTNTAESGLLALYGVCTHLGCLPKWVATNQRFECPCHGSKFELSGAWIEGPAPRNLDSFAMTVFYDDGTSATTDADGNGIQLDPSKSIAKIEVNTGSRIIGKLHG